MAARRVASSSVNWTALAERVPKDQKQMYISLKARSDNYLRRVMANPETAPKIDFASYKSKIPVSGLVDSLQKQFEALKVPYPSDKDKLLSAIDSQEKEAAQEVTKFIADSNNRIKQYQGMLAKWDEVLPFEEMTLEDFYDAFPEHALDPLCRPTFWPHTPDEQPGYKPPEAEQQAQAAH